MSRTQLPPFKLQFDVAVRVDFFVATVVCVDISNSILEAETKILSGIQDLLVAEAHAALLASSLAHNLHLTNFLIEGDSSLVAPVLK